MRYPINLILLIGFINFSASGQSAQSENALRTCLSAECIQKDSNTVGKIVINKNNRSEVFPLVAQCKNLNSLSIEGIRLREFPELSAQQTELTQVSISHCRRVNQEELFENLVRLPSLSSLKLDHCFLFHISPIAQQLNGLKELDISNNYLTNVPGGIFDHTQLTSLNIANNRIKEVPAEIQISSTLKELNIYGNKNLDAHLFFSYLQYNPSIESLVLGPNMTFPKPANKTTIQRIKVVNQWDKGLLEWLHDQEGISSLSIVYPGVDVDPKDLNFLSSDSNFLHLEIKSRNTVDLSSDDLQLSHLKSLKLEGNKLILPPLDSSICKNLNELEIQNSSFNEGSSLDLHDLAELKVIKVRNSDGLNDIQMKRLPQLTTVELSENLQALLKPEVDPKYELVESDDPTNQVVDDLVYTEELIVEDAGNEESFTYKPGKSKVIKTKSDYEIKIPENAFVNSDGDPVTEPVKLEVKSFENPLEIALSGIPMASANPDNELQMFSSSAMFTVQLAPGQEGISINPDAPLEVNLPVNRNSDTLYALDAESKSWSSSQNDTLQQISSDQISSFVGNLINNEVIPQPRMPAYPSVRVEFDRYELLESKQRNKGSFSFSLGARHMYYGGNSYHKRFGYQRVLRRYKWIYDGPNSEAMHQTIDSIGKSIHRYYANKYSRKATRFNGFRPAIIRGMSIRPNPAADNFIFSLKINNQILDIPCYPQIRASNHDIEAKKIQQLYKSYQRSYARSEKKWDKIDMKIQAAWEKYNDEMAQYEEDMEAYRKKMAELGLDLFRIELPDTVLAMTYEEITASNIQIPVSQSFRINNFGTFNEDIYYKMAEPVKFKGRILASDGQELEPESIIVIDKTRNGTLSLNWKKRFIYDATSDVAVIALLPDGKMAVVSSNSIREEFQQGDHELTAKVFDSTSISFKELEAAL